MDIAPKDYSNPTDADADNVYVVTVRATSSTTGLHTDQVISVSVADVADNPNFASQTIYVGYLTRANHGAVPLAAPGLGIMIGLPVTSWTLTRTAGDSTAWPSSVTTGLTPAPSRALTVTDDGTTATYSITADGVDTGETLTISVTGNGYTASTKAQIDSDLRASGIRNALGGRTIYLQRGSETAWANAANGGSGAADVCLFRGFNGHTGRFKITSSDVAHPTTIGRLQLLGTKNVDIEDLNFEHSVASMAGGDAQGNAMLYGGGNATFGNCAGVEVRNCTFGTNSPDPDDASTWKSGIGLEGQSATSLITDCIVEDCTFERVKDGYTCGRASNMIFRRLTVDRFCSNASFQGGAKLADVLQQDVVHKRPMFNPGDPQDHRDFSQFGHTSVAANYERITVENCAFLTLDGDAAGQGLFFNDVGYSGYGTGVNVGGANYLSGYVFVDCVIRNVIYEGVFSNGLTLDLGDWTVENVSLVRGACTGLGSGQRADPVMRADRLTGADSNIYQATGTVTGVVAHGFPSSTGLTLVDCVNMGASGLPSNSNNEVARAAFYDDWFQDPTNADPLVGFRPKIGGPLDLGGGKFIGALDSTGGWATAV